MAGIIPAERAPTSRALQALQKRCDLTLNRGGGYLWWKPGFSPVGGTEHKYVPGNATSNATRRGQLRVRYGTSQSRRRRPRNQGRQSQAPAPHRRANSRPANNGRRRPLLRRHHHASSQRAGGAARRGAQPHAQSFAPLSRQGIAQRQKGRGASDVRRAAGADLRAFAIERASEAARAVRNESGEKVGTGSSLRNEC